MSKLFTITNEKTHKIYHILGINFRFKKIEYCNFVNVYLNRNIKQNVYIQFYGLHGHRPQIKKNTDFLKWLLFYKECFEYFILKRINIPQIEFTLTTKCTLKCKKCINYIPYIKKQEHQSISLADFKKQLDNLSKVTNKIRNLILIGGEPLLINNLDEYCEYAAKNNQIERIWIITNGTMLLNQKLINVLTKYSNKITIWISNYSANPELQNILKIDELLKQINEANLEYFYDKNLMWGYNSEYPTKQYREKEPNYFLTCNTPCVSVFAGKVYVCPRAGVFNIKKLYEQSSDEILDLNNKISKKDLIKFYSKNFFDACKYCSRLEDLNKGSIIPAEQIK